MADWKAIKKIWEYGGDLTNTCAQYKLTLPDVSLVANAEGWGERGAKTRVKPNEIAIIDFSAPILDDKQVSLAHKTDLGRLRMVAACVLEGMQGENSHEKLLKTTERLVKIYAQLIPLERKVFGMDDNPDDTPDSIIIKVRKSIKNNEEPK